MRNLTNADVANAPAEVKARLAFLTWLKKDFPEVYKRAVVDSHAELSPPGVGGIFDSISSAIGKIDFGKLSENIVKAGTAVIAVKGQKDILKLNLERAKAGQPPIDPASMYTTPTINTDINLDPSARRWVDDSLQSMQTPLLIGGAALLLFILLRKKR